jgi:hypothetical protein
MTSMADAQRVDDALPKNGAKMVLRVAQQGAELFEI